MTNAALPSSLRINAMLESQRMWSAWRFCSIGSIPQIRFLLLRLALFLLLLLSTNTANASSSSSASSYKYADHPPNEFVPGGRLESVEVLAQDAWAEGKSHTLVVAVTCHNGSVVAVSTQPESPHLPLNLTESNTQGNNNNNHSSFAPLLLPNTMHRLAPFARLSQHVWGVSAGRTVDGQLVRATLHRIADALRQRNPNGEIQASQVAHHLADAWQTKTQQLGHGRVLSSFALIISASGASGARAPQLWRVDPTGQFYQCHAAALGRQGQAAEATLVSKLKQFHQKRRQSMGSYNNTSTDNANGNDNDEPTHQQVQETLNALSTDEALRLCCETIWETLQPKTAETKTTKPSNEEWVDSAQLAPTVCGVTLFSNSSTDASWFSHADLEKLRQRNETAETEQEGSKSAA